MFTLHIGALLAEPDLMLIVQRELLDGAPRSLTLINGLMQKLLDGLVTVLREGKRLGYVRPELHEVTFLMLLSRAIEGSFFLHRQLRGRAQVVSEMAAPDAEAVLDRLCVAFLDGAILPTAEL